MSRRRFCVALLGLAGCGAEWSVPRQTDAGLTVQVLPSGSPERAPSVLRLAIAGVDQRSSIADFRLFSGTLSPYHLGRIAAREEPSTLLERELPLAAWAEGGTVMLGPVRALELGTYTVATPELGRVVEFVVTETVPVLARLWPPRSVLEGVGPLV